MFSEESQLFIQRIYNLWCQQSSNTKRVRTIVPVVNPKPIGELANTGIPHKIVEEIKHLTHSIQHEFVYENGRTVILQFFSYSPMEFKQKMFVQKINALYNWFSLANHYAPKTCSPTWIVHIYLTDAKKELPIKIGHELTQFHCNTAFTYACKQIESDCYVFRNEEWFRVVIHESFHAFGLDFSLIQENLQSRLHNLYPAVKSQILLSETYTETWATILNALFIHGTKANRFEESAKTEWNIVWTKFVKSMKNEREFMMHQAAKILRHHRFSNYLHLFEEKKTLTENVGAFAYYVLKSQCLWNIDGFIQWTMIHNKGTLTFRNPVRNSHAFFTFMELSSKNEEYIVELNRLLKERIVDRTLRFTITE